MTTWLTGSSGASVAMCEVLSGLHSAEQRLLSQHNRWIPKSTYEFLGERDRELPLADLRSCCSGFRLVAQMCICLAMRAEKHSISAPGSSPQRNCTKTISFSWKNLTSGACSTPGCMGQPFEENVLTLASGKDQALNFVRHFSFWC